MWTDHGGMSCFPVRVSISSEEISAGSLAETVNELQAAEPFKILHEMMKR
jgi:hypothetical protein